MNLSVVGGDMRFVSLARQLSVAGLLVQSAGFDRIAPEIADLKNKPLAEAVQDAEIVVLPLPVSNDEMFLNAPFSTEPIALDKVMPLLSGKRVFCGKITEKIKALAQKNGVMLEDYFDREELQILNAIPTAEGALEILLAELPVTIWGLNALICGYGRIGKYLSKILGALGAEVTVAARKQCDFAWISAHGFKSTDYKSLQNKIQEFDVVFNTVPECVVTKDLLCVMKPDVLIVDLASKPGGVDLAAAGEYDRKVIWALSLPGKVAPITAGKIIADTVLNMLKEAPIHGYSS